MKARGSRICKTSILLAFVIFLMSTNVSCNFFGALDNPLDPEADLYQGFTTVTTSSEIRPAIPKNGGRLFDGYLTISEVIGATAYEIRIAETAEELDTSPVFQKDDYTTNTFNLQDVTLVLFQTYFWKARAFQDGAWDTVWSKSWTFVYEPDFSDPDRGQIEDGRPLQRISIKPNGAQLILGSALSSMSSFGRYIAFASASDELTPNDYNNEPDIFVHDRYLNTTECVSVSDAGQIGDGGCENSQINSTGQYVVFESNASNLVDNDHNGERDIFLFDRGSKTIKRVSVSIVGNEANSYSYYPSISNDGTLIAFSSNASNLVPGDVNGCIDVFVYNTRNNSIIMVSVDSVGNQGNGDSIACQISGDGQFVVFRSIASNLVLNDTNNSYDIFSYHLKTGAIERISKDFNGIEGNNNSLYSHINTDGNYIVFSSEASNLVENDTNDFEDIFLYNRITNSVQRINMSSEGNQANSYSNNPKISADGRYIIFESCAGNLVPGAVKDNIDIYVYDSLTGDIWQIQVLNDSYCNISISQDGRFISFNASLALVGADTNDCQDVYVSPLQHP